MYGFVPYNLSEIQKSIQFGHAVVEYGLKYGTTEDYISWATQWKTFIILNGGTTSLNPKSPGSLNLHMETLEAKGIPFSVFHEPDLGDQLTAVVFLVDERIFKKSPYTDDPKEKCYPDFFDYLRNEEPGGIERTTYSAGMRSETPTWAEQYPHHYKNWLEFIGGEKQLFLRNFLKPFKLA